MISWSPTSMRGDQTSTGAANGYQYDMPYVGTVDMVTAAERTLALAMY
jgi:hypothetical protein